MSATIDVGTLALYLRLKDEMAPAIAQARQQLTSLGTDFRARAAEIGQQAQEIGGRMTSLGKDLTVGLSLPLAAIGGSALKLAMDVTESENLFSVSFGEMAAAAREWSENVNASLGSNQFKLREHSATLFTMMQSMGLTKEEAFKMATSMTTLSRDMGSFYNLDHQTAFDKLRAGIVGEAEPLKQLGILVNESTVKAAAYRAGIAAVGSELTEQQKVQARYLTIMEQTSKAQGDLARTMDSPTNQLRLMKEQMTEAATQLGMALLPAMSDLLGILKDAMPAISGAVKWFSDLPAPVRNTTVVIGGLLVALGPVVAAIGSMITTIGALMPALSALGPALAVLTGPIGLVVAAVVGLTAIWFKWGDDIKRIVRETIEAVSTWFVDRFGPVIEPMKALLGDLGELWNAFSALISAVAAKVVDSISGMVTSVVMWMVDKLRPIWEPLAAALTRVQEVFSAMGSAVAGIVQRTYEAIKGWLFDKFNAVVESIREKVQAVTGFFKDMYDKVVGGSYVPDLIKGIAAEFGKLPTAMVAPTVAATNQVTATFGGMQGPIIGHVTTWMNDFTNTVKTGTSNLFGGGKVGGIFGEMVGGGIGAAMQKGEQLLSGLFAGKGGLMQDIVKGGLTAVGDLIVPGFGQILGQLSGVVSEGLKKIGGFFKSMFGGPSAKELAGREIVHEFAKHLDTMLTDAQRIEAGNEDWKKTVIVVRDAYLALGRTEQEALADVKAMWESEQHGADAAKAAVDRIREALNRIPRDIDVDVDVNYEEHNRPDPLDNSSGSRSRARQGFATGTGGRFLDFGAGTQVVLHGKQRVQTEGEGRAEKRAQDASLDRLERLLERLVADQPRQLKIAMSQAAAYAPRRR